MPYESPTRRSGSRPTGVGSPAAIPRETPRLPLLCALVLVLVLAAALVHDARAGDLRAVQGQPTTASQPPSQSPSTAAGADKPQDLLRHIGTVVEIRTTAIQGAESSTTLGKRRSGSGTILDASTVLTIGYLLLEADDVEIVTASGRTIPGSVAGYDHETGLGLVKAALPLEGTPIELGDSDKVSERQRVLTLGHSEPRATELVVISRKPFVGSWEYLLDQAIFTFPPVNNWSGAALMTDDGKLIGIGSLMVNDAASSQPGVPGNMFVPINLLKPIIGDLMAKGRRSGPARPWLGLTTETVRGNLIISRVTQRGPAAQAGLVPGDIIVGVGETRVDDQLALYRGIWKIGPAGATIPLRVLHAGAVREVSVRSMDRADFLRKPDGI